MYISRSHILYFIPLHLAEAAEPNVKNLPPKKRKLPGNEWMTSFKIPKIAKSDQNRSNRSIAKSYLKLKPLDEYEIDTMFRDIHSKNDDAQFEQLYSGYIDEARVDEKAYLKTRTAMIHFEELANNKLESGFELKRVNFQLHSHADQLFRIKNDVSQLLYSLYTQINFSRIILLF